VGRSAAPRAGGGHQTRPKEIITWVLALGGKGQDGASRPVRSEDHSLTACSPEKIEPVAVPVNVVKRLIASRGSLPDHPIRPSIETADGNQKLFALLTVGLLVVRTSDFDVWYQSERAKGRWPSQRSKLKINGRPTKQTDRLRDAVLGARARSQMERQRPDLGVASYARCLRLFRGSEPRHACSSGRPFAPRNGRSRAFADHPRAAQVDLVNVRFGAHNGLKSDIEPRPLCANNGSREVIRSPRGFSRKQRPGCFAQLL